MADTDPDNILFISHNATDRPYAVALEKAIKDLIKDKDTLIDVKYSSSDEAGPQGGEQWREWIYKHVVVARTAVILVTPHALGKPWLMWEAGACRGVALARHAAGSTATSTAGAPPKGAVGNRIIVSLAYGVTENECPDPLRADQIIRGTDIGRMDGLLVNIVEAHGGDAHFMAKVGRRMENVLNEYKATVQNLMLRTPSLVTEANVQDWLARLDQFEKLERFSELKSFERWMMLAFGREDETAGVPIDVRLHRRLGELYLKQNEFARAAEQLNLARKAAPRDIYVLRPLAEASMKRVLADQQATAESAAPHDDIETLLTAMQELDEQAFVSTPDAAALRGKYLRRVKRDRQQAVEVYRAALAATPDSYYLADLLAQTELELGRTDQAKASFDRALRILETLTEKNLWTHATAATAGLAVGNLDKVREHLSAIATLGPSKSESDTISGGFREVAKRLGVAEDAERMLLVLTSDKSASV